MKHFLFGVMLLISVSSYAKRFEINLIKSGTLSEYTSSDEAKSADSLIISGDVILSTEDFTAIKKLIVSYNVIYVDIFETLNSNIGGEVFYGCGKLVGFRFPKASTSIGWYCFEKCTRLKDVYFPETLKSFGTGAFRSCAIEKVTIPKNVETIENQAFYYCPLTDIYCEPMTPPNCNVSAFIAGSGNITNTILHVPLGTKALYEQADGWSYFTNIVETSNNVHKVSINRSGNGSVLVNGTKVDNSFVNIEEGSSVTFDFIPENGYKLNYVSYNNTDVTDNVTNNTYFIESLDNDVLIYAGFEIKQFNIIIKSADNGIIKHIVDYGSSQTYQFIPSDGWQLNSVSYNGYDITSSLVDNKYTTPTITSDAELVIIYKSSVDGIKTSSNSEKLKVRAIDGGIIISNESSAITANVYHTNGSVVFSKEIGKGSTEISLEKNNMYIIKIGKTVYKVLL